MVMAGRSVDLTTLFPGQATSLQHIKIDFIQLNGLVRFKLIVNWFHLSKLKEDLKKIKCKNRNSF